MVGEWEDSVRYIGATLEEGSPRVRLEGTKRIEVDDDAQRVSLHSKTQFPNGKTLEMRFTGELVEEAYGKAEEVQVYIRLTPRIESACVSTP